MRGSPTLSRLTPALDIHGPEPGNTPQALARSLAALRAVLQATTNAILVIDNEHRVTDCNDRFVAMWDLPAEILGKGNDAALLEWVERCFADPAAFRARISSIYASDPPTTDILRLLDGRAIERHSRPQVVDGATIGRVWSFLDITEAEQTKVRLRDEAEIQAWMSRTGSALSSTLEPCAVVDALAAASISLSGALRSSFIAHPLVAGHELLGAGKEDGGPSPLASALGRDGKAVLARITRDWQQAFSCDDLGQAATARELLALSGTPLGDLGVRSLLVVPVTAGPGVVLGALALEHPAPRVFCGRAQRLVATLATHAAPAINNARLHALVRNESTERKLLSNLQKTTTQRLQNLSRRLMQAEEEERRRLGRELHDRVGASLSALGMGLELLRQQLPDDRGGAIDRRMRDLQEILGDTMAHVRCVLADLRPTALDELGLFPALRHQSGVLSARSGMRFLVSGGEPVPRLSGDCEIAFYRVAQEAWTNAMKHSGAESVMLCLTEQAGRVTMVVEDDGRGFEPANLLPEIPTLGLTTMRERAEAIGAVLEVATTAGAGVRIQLSLARPAPAPGTH